MTATPSPSSVASTAVHATRPLAAALSIGAIALLILGVQPIVLGALVEQHLITLPGVGVVAMGEIIALGIGVALGDALLPVSWQRATAIVAALLAAALNLATVQAQGDAAFVALRAVAGLAEGLLVWVATVSIVRAATPDRVTAVFMVLQALAQIALAAALALWVLPAAGWKGGFVAMATTCLLVLPLAAALPVPASLARAADAQCAATATARLRWSPATLAPLLVAFLQMSAIGALWAYLEPLALRAGLDAHAAQLQTSWVLGMQIVGGLAAIYWVRRLSVTATLTLGSVALCLVAAAMYRVPGNATLGFAAVCVAFGFAWMFLMPFHVGLALRADVQGRVAVLVPAAQLIGSACGPLLASLLLHADDPAPVPLVGLGFALTAALLALWIGRRQRRPAVVEAGSHAG